VDGGALGDHGGLTDPVTRGGDPPALIVASDGGQMIGVVNPFKPGELVRVPAGLHVVAGVARKD